ncbi:MAG: hypothetical protein KGZ42_03690, partial [Melioribacter sp.]|nr:hypothetical protein [Melioribacter sp.]
AVASAYSLYDYEIANDLGGEYAYNNLNERARRKGIRLASDMVPNHTGIFSKWVIERPDYFIQSNFPPFPNYRFTGPDLSDDPTVSIRIEDGYWSRSDAAVVFQRVDNRTGDVRYIYHGNDGTNMPWNDTAQLNMIKSEVREAVIQKIFDVARKFSIIRFDAAMTLAKKHFSRLWYPVPGRGGDIPSRSDYSISQEEFDRQFPKEFWREVVDRINNEMPETLLLAEAFWLMEGYFVRTLGMHRVYNSAFMHMMMKEENAKYRDLISNTLEFEPEILKRYVNFMSNPDEETAIKQFGTDDKYFGVCTLMVTLPGLPMFAHGQIEGFTEKYGMEYQRAYYNESPNQWLVERHKREIFPLMKKRYLFSQVTNFWLFDFYDGYGNLNENIFAYSNSERGDRAIVIFNNKYQNTSGTIFRSSPKLISSYDKKELQTKTLGEALGVNPTLQHFYIYREHVSNLEYLKSGSEFAFEGFRVELGAFRYLVYLDFREVYDGDGEYEKLARKLKGKGVPSIETSLAEMRLEPIHHAFENLFDDEMLGQFITPVVLGEVYNNQEVCCELLTKRFARLQKTIKNYYNLENDGEEILSKFRSIISTIRDITVFMNKHFFKDKDLLHRDKHHAFVLNGDFNYKENLILLLQQLVITFMKELFDEVRDVNSSNYYEKLMLSIPLRRILLRLGKGEYELHREILLLNILIQYNGQIRKLFSTEYESFSVHPFVDILIEIMNDNRGKLFIGVNEYEGITYYNKESFDELLGWLFTISLIQKDYSTGKLSDKLRLEEKKLIEGIQNKLKTLSEIRSLSDESSFMIDKLIEGLIRIH